MTTASKITLLRVVFIPLYMLFMYLSKGTVGLFMWIALGIFIIASITDYIDGFIAGVKAEMKEDEIIFAATEQRSPEEVEALVESIAAFCAENGL